jgi:hypothetical protein
MADRPANQSATHVGSTTGTHKPKPKPKAKPKAAAGKGKGKYNWGDGLGGVHSIPLATHKQNVQAKAALGGNLDLTAPPTGVQAVQEANAAADLQYGPQVQAATQLQSNVEPWFRDYLARVAGYAQVAQNQSAPVLNQAQAYQQGAAAQTAPGLDPNSQAGQQSAQAAQGRQAIAQLGLDALNTQSQATQDYFGGQRNVASRVQPQMQMAADQGLANAKSQRGAAVTGFLTTARQNAQNYAIARGTLGLNSAKAIADADQTAATTTETIRHHQATETNAANSTKAAQRAKRAAQKAAGKKPNQYGIPEAQWEHWSTEHRQRVIDAFNAKKHAGTGDSAAAKKKAAEQKAAQKHATDVHGASGKVENTVTDIIGAWNGYAGKTTDDTTKPKDPKTGQYPARKLGPDDIRALLAKDYTPQMIHIALLRRVGKTLDQASIDYLHNLDPNIRIPKDWLPPVPNGRGDPKPTSGQQNGLGGK